MRILAVTGIFPPDIGGPASYVPRMARALTERGHELEVVTLADAPLVLSSGDPYPVHRITRQMQRPLRVTRTVAAIATRAREADVVYANGLVLESVAAARISRRPLVVKVVGDLIWERARNAGRSETLDDFQTAQLPLGWRALRHLQNKYMRAAGHVITPSAYLKRIVTGWGVPEPRITVVYNAVPQPPEQACPGPAFDLVSVGRLVAWKGFAELIALAARRDWSLRIVGDGPLRADLERQAAAAGARVRFDGHLPQEHVAAAICSGRVFVLNSSYEGLPHIVLEAMAVGVPVVATGVGGTPETMSDGSGILVPAGAAEPLEAALAELLSDPERGARMAKRAAAMLRERFSFVRMVDETEKVLRMAAARGMGGAG